MPQGKEARLRELAGLMSARIDALRGKQQVTNGDAFRAFADLIPQVVWTAGPDGEVTFFNRRYYEFFGVTDCDWLAFIHPEDRQPTLDAWGSALATGQPYWNTARFRDQDGRYHRVVSRATAVRDDGGRILYWVGSTAIAGPAEAMLQVA